MPKPGDVESQSILIGRLLEATQAAGDALKTISEEVREHGNDITLLREHVAAIDRIARELDQLVRTGEDSLRARVKFLEDGDERDQKDGDELTEVVEHLKERVSKLEQHKSGTEAKYGTLIWAAAIFGWFLNLAIAVYAAVGQWHGGGK